MAPKNRKLRKLMTRKNEDASNWLKSLTSYIKKTQRNVLNLEEKGLGTAEIKSVLHFLSDSQVTELNLKSNCLSNGMSYLVTLLCKTKIRKLNISECSLTKEDLIQLLKVLKDSQITDLDVSGCVEDESFSLDEPHQCISHLQNSKLSTLNLSLFSLFPPITLAPFFKQFLKTTLTSLDLKGAKCDSDDFIFMFENLGQSSVKNLSLNNTQISSIALQELSRRLVETNIEKLDLSQNSLGDDQLKILVKKLDDSKITDLDLSHNSFSTVGPLLTKLNGSQIKILNLYHNRFLKTEEVINPNSLRHSSLVTLNLGSCQLGDEAGERWMETLRFSNVTKLDISHNHFGLSTVKKLAENINDINLIYLNISGNALWPDAFLILGGCLRDSKLTRLGASNIKPIRALKAIHLLSFLKLTEGSFISQIEMNSYDSIWNLPPVWEPKMLMDTKFTELHLCFSFIRDGISSLAQFLKFTCIVHLNLSYNGITDQSAATLADCLKETQIRRLNLGNNSITNHGAKSLALSFKDTHLLYLHLNANKIENEGLECLAENAKDTLVSELNVANNPGKRVLLVDKVLWQNKILVHKLVDIFKLIAPQINSNEFCFDQNCDGLDVNTFLEKCMWFYKTIVDKPRAIHVLLDENCVSRSGEEIHRLVVEKFPLQFSEFVASRVQANVLQHVSILGKAEEMGLTAVVESLLLNRPIYVLDEEKGILHPYVYQLLLKYKQPICNLAVEPHGVIKIIDYYTKHANIIGAKDLISALCVANIS